MRSRKDSNSRSPIEQGAIEINIHRRCAILVQNPWQWHHPRSAQVPKKWYEADCRGRRSNHRLEAGFWVLGKAKIVLMVLAVASFLPFRMKSVLTHTFHVAANHQYQRVRHNLLSN